MQHESVANMLLSRIYVFQTETHTHHNSQDDTTAFYMSFRVSRYSYKFGSFHI